MTRLFETRGGNAKFNAQQNLQGRTPYVNDDSLSYHKARIISEGVVDNGLLYAIIESIGLDMDNTRRGFRYVVFNVFGHVISRVPLEECSRTAAQARKALWAYLNTVDVIAETRKAAERVERRQAQEMAELRKLLAERERVTL